MDLDESTSTKKSLVSRVANTCFVAFLILLLIIAVVIVLFEVRSSPSQLHININDSRDPKAPPTMISSRKTVLYRISDTCITSRLVTTSLNNTGNILDQKSRFVDLDFSQFLWILFKTKNKTSHHAFISLFPLIYIYFPAKICILSLFSFEAHVLICTFLTPNNCSCRNFRLLQ